MSNILWTFKTKNFETVLSWEYEECPDLSWDETGEITEKLNSGELGNFTFWVHVFGPNGQELACESLGNSIYADPSVFARDHRDSDPMNRNCTLMRAAWRGEGDPSAKVSISHYFPGMISEAIGGARKALAGLQSVRLRV